MDCINVCVKMFLLYFKYMELTKNRLAKLVETNKP